MTGTVFMVRMGTERSLEANSADLGQSHRKRLVNCVDPRQMPQFATHPAILG